MRYPSAYPTGADGVDPNPKSLIEENQCIYLIPYLGRQISEMRADVHFSILCCIRSRLSANYNGYRWCWRPQSV